MIGKRWNIFYGYASKTTAWIVEIVFLRFQSRASCRARIQFPPFLFECNNWIVTSCDAQTQTLFRLTPGESGCKIFPRRWMDLEVQLQGWLRMSC
jgi:hypothetical protein